MSGGGSNTAGDGAPARKPELLRIKRRRGEAVTDEIIVATAQPRADPKRLRMDQMLLQLSGLGMTQQEAASPEPQRRQRFRRVTTVDLVTFENKTAVEVESMLAAWSSSAQEAQAKAQVQPTASETTEGYVSVPPPAPPTGSCAEAAAPVAAAAAVVGGAEEAGARPGATPSTPSRRQAPKAAPQGPGTAERMKGALRDMAMQRSTSARYLQVRSRRHAQQRQQPEQPEDQAALQAAFHIYDLVCTDVDEGAAAQRAAERAERRRQAKEQAAKAASEGAILMNYMPMVHQFLEQQGQAPPAEEKQLAAAAAADAGAVDSTSISNAATPAAPSAPSQQQQQEAMEEDDEDVFVYDVYLPVDTTDESMAEVGEAMGVPVVEVEDHDDPFFEADVSDHDSEDSNAESFYANSYPDEDEYASGSEADEEGWCHVQQRGGATPGRAGERWDDEEYDLTKEETAPSCHTSRASAAHPGRRGVSGSTRWWRWGWPSRALQWRRRRGRGSRASGGYRVR